MTEHTNGTGPSNRAFVRVPRGVARERSLNPYDFRVLVHVVSYYSPATNDRPEGLARPGQPRIARETGIGQEQVRRSLRSLEGQKFLTLVERGGGARKPNSYRPGPKWTTWKPPTVEGVRPEPPTVEGATPHSRGVQTPTVEGGGRTREVEPRDFGKKSGSDTRSDTRSKSYCGLTGCDCKDWYQSRARHGSPEILKRMLEQQLDRQKREELGEAAYFAEVWGPMPKPRET